MNAVFIAFKSTFQTNTGPAVKGVIVHLARNHIVQDMDIVHNHRTMVSKAVKIIAPNPISQGIKENLQIKEKLQETVLDTFDLFIHMVTYATYHNRRRYLWENTIVIILYLYL